MKGTVNAILTTKKSRTMEEGDLQMLRLTAPEFFADSIYTAEEIKSMSNI